ncbi:hypothetical protein FQN54_006719 [Arachnomyces sp. PD_36]|nr:hypothetical protein FQN54_006719 [Arachnomyces sp. PD_36]
MSKPLAATRSTPRVMVSASFDKDIGGDPASTGSSRKGAKLWTDEEHQLLWRVLTETPTMATEEIRKSAIRNKIKIYYDKLHLPNPPANQQSPLVHSSTHDKEDEWEDEDVPTPQLSNLFTRKRKSGDSPDEVKQSSKAVQRTTSGNLSSANDSPSNGERGNTLADETDAQLVQEVVGPYLWAQLREQGRKLKSEKRQADKVRAENLALKTELKELKSRLKKMDDVQRLISELAVKPEPDTS